MILNNDPSLNHVCAKEIHMWYGFDKTFPVNFHIKSITPLQTDDTANVACGVLHGQVGVTSSLSGLDECVLMAVSSALYMHYDMAK